MVQGHSRAVELIRQCKYIIIPTQINANQSFSLWKIRVLGPLALCTSSSTPSNRATLIPIPSLRYHCPWYRITSGLAFHMQFLFPLALSAHDLIHHLIPPLWIGKKKCKDISNEPKTTYQWSWPLCQSLSLWSFHLLSPVLFIYSVFLPVDHHHITYLEVHHYLTSHPPHCAPHFQNRL